MDMKWKRNNDDELSLMCNEAAYLISGSHVSTRGIEACQARDRCRMPSCMTPGREDDSVTTVPHYSRIVL